MCQQILYRNTEKTIQEQSPYIRINGQQTTDENN